MTEEYRNGTRQLRHLAKCGEQPEKRVEAKFATSSRSPDGSTTVAYLAGVRDDGRLWKLSEEDVIQSIKHGVVFYVVAAGKELQVIISRRQNREYIKTTMDRYDPEMLLSLPDCP